MSGAASQCDTFDYKPKLLEKHGEKFDPGGKIELFQSSPENVMKSPWAWKPYGQCGKWMSDLVPHIASCVDDIAFLPAMVSKSNVHGPATFLQTTGFVLPGFPSVGAWVAYGLGSMNENLPTFVVLPDSRGFAAQWPGELGFRLLARDRARDDGQGREQKPDSRPVPAEGCESLERHRGRRPSDTADSQSSAQVLPRGRFSARCPNRVVRTGRATCSSVRPRCSISTAKPPLRNTFTALMTQHRRLRPKLPGGATAARTRRAIRASLERCRQRLPAPKLGFARRHRPRSRRNGPRHGSARRRTYQRSEVTRNARRHDRDLDDRIRPHAVQPGRQGPRSQSVDIHLLAGGRRHQGRRDARSERRMVVQGD